MDEREKEVVEPSEVGSVGEVLGGVAPGTQDPSVEQEQAVPAAPVTEMPRYRCHKEVRAARIVAVNQIHSSGAAQLSFPGQTPGVEVNGSWMAKHMPMAGGYYVLYDDGYASFSPAGAFEDGYALVE